MYDNIRSIDAVSNKQRATRSNLLPIPCTEYGESSQP